MMSYLLILIISFNCPLELILRRKLVLIFHKEFLSFNAQARLAVALGPRFFRGPKENPDFFVSQIFRINHFVHRVALLIIFT